MSISSFFSIDYGRKKESLDKGIGRGDKEEKRDITMLRNRRGKGWRAMTWHSMNDSK